MYSNTKDAFLARIEEMKKKGHNINGRAVRMYLRLEDEKTEHPWGWCYQLFQGKTEVARYRESPRRLLAMLDELEKDPTLDLTKRGRKAKVKDDVPKVTKKTPKKKTSKTPKVPKERASEKAMTKAAKKITTDKAQSVHPLIIGGKTIGEVAKIKNGKWQVISPFAPKTYRTKTEAEKALVTNTIKAEVA